MSKKTLLKRTALVAVATLGFGLLSSVPASAALSSITAGTLAEKTGQTTDKTLKVVNTTASALAPQYAISTRNTTVAHELLQAAVTATYGATNDTYAIKVTATLPTTGNAVANFLQESSAATVSNGTGAGSISTRVFPATWNDATAGTVAAGITATTLAATTAGAVYYYVIQATAGNYVAADDVLIKVTVYQTGAEAVSATLDTATTTYAGRIGQQVAITPTADLTSTTAANTTHPVLRVAAAITTQPAASAGGSSVYPTISAVSTLDSDLLYADTVSTVGTTNVSSSTGAAADATGPTSINYSGEANVVISGTDVALGTVAFTPLVKGVYTLVVWNETSTTGTAALSGSESFQTFTINVVDAVSTVSITAVNSTFAKEVAASNADEYGALVKVSLKDAAGNISIPATGESVVLTPSGTGDIAYVNNVAVSSTAGAAYSLPASAFGNTGTAWVNISNEAAETFTVVATYTGSASASVSLTSRTVTNSATDKAPQSFGLTGFAGGSFAAGAAGTVNYPRGSVTGTFFMDTAYAATTYSGVLVTDTLGTITGVAGLKYAAATTVSTDVDGLGTDGALFSVSWTAPSAANTANIFTIAEIDTTAAAALATTVSTIDVAAGTATATPGTINAVPGATTTVNVTLKDNFGRAFANQTMSASVTGRNPTLVNKTALTDSLGNASFTFTDANTTSVITSDTITVTGGSAAKTVTVLYGTANAPSTITLTSTGDTDVIPGTTKTDIDASATGATGTSATASAVVKNSAGSAVAGVAVTFTVTGLVGAEVHTTKAVVYTDSTGKAVSNISSYAAGKATVTATAGTATASDDIYFSQQTAAEARTIAISATGGLVKATVKDRYGNVIEGVAVNATRTGTGYFGAGASTATGNTDKDGVVEFNFVGSGTVTVAFTSTTYGQSYAAAGYDFDAVNGTAVTASAAGTAATNQKGLGAALAPAGINSASLAVEGINAAEANASAAADAAAEATDAANAATDAANAAAEAADAATAAAQDAADAVAALSVSVTEMVNALKKQITSLTNLVIKIQKKVRA